MDESRKLQLLNYLVDELCSERDESAPDTDNVIELWDAFRAMVNTRPPWPIGGEFLAAQDELLQGLSAEAGVHEVGEATPSSLDSRIALWRGDITALAVDAIVNAANSQLLGCWIPGHFCIDNTIHTFAGVQLRLECARIMDDQGHEEPTGQAKITPAYNLPSKYVIHTVGPIADGHPSDLHRKQLACCYANCLDLAEKNGLESIAFCCISTGVFGFPHEEAAEIAVRSVREWLDATGSGMAVIFNVFGEKNSQIYRSILKLD